MQLKFIEQLSNNAVIELLKIDCILYVEKNRD